LLDELLREFLNFLRRERQLDFQKFRAARQPFEMLRQPERPAIRHADRFKQAVAQQETPVVQGNHRFGFRHKFSVEKNNHEKNPFPNAVLISRIAAEIQALAGAPARTPASLKFNAARKPAAFASVSSYSAADWNRTRCHLTLDKRERESSLQKFHMARFLLNGVLIP
jgi:hypothetical protein